ncbi:MAG: hypothetical protein H0W96_15310 [Solirubrobacterales bacterium]|nr:hypothetical protein [Solirubrobacterales bacterium]
MARLARTAFLATLLIAAAALAACGGDTDEKNRYIRELTAAQTTYQATAERLEAGATTTSTPTEDRRTLDRFAAAINDTVAALRRIKVPPEVVAEHRRFVAVFVTWHDDVARFVAAVKNHPTRRGIKRAERRIAVANQTFNDRVRAAGIDIDAKLGS